MATPGDDTVLEGYTGFVTSYGACAPAYDDGHLLYEPMTCPLLVDRVALRAQGCPLGRGGRYEATQSRP